MQDGAEITTLEDYFGYITKLAKYDHDDTSNNSPAYDPSKIDNLNILFYQQMKKYFD